MSDSALSAALDYRRRGLSVVSIADGTKRPDRDWQPYQTRLATDAEIASWFAGCRRRGVAIITGQVSGGLVIRDYDDLHAYRTWSTSYPDLASMLPTVATKRGRHLYFTTADTTHRELADGEYRGERHLTLAPPSWHPDGGQYTWTIALPDGPLPFIIDPVKAGLLPPDVFVTGKDHATQDTQETQDIHVYDGPPPFVGGEIERAIADTLPPGPGKRWSCLFRFAQHLRFLSSGELPPAQLEAVVREWLHRAVHARTRDWDENWQDFCVGYLEAAQPPGGKLRLAAVAARQAILPKDKLIAVCRTLAAPDGRFFLSCATGAKPTGLSPDTVHRLLAVLQVEQRVKLLQVGDKHRSKGGKASEWLWIKEN